MTQSNDSGSPDGCPPGRKTAYGYEELLQCARGELFDPDSAKLPLPDMLMTDRVTRIVNNGGKYGKGEIIAELDKAVGQVPALGICLGHQLLALALGATTYKLKFGHRGANHPVKDLRTGRVAVTSQNHGYAVDPDTLPARAEVTHVNLNDHTCEGFLDPDAKLLAVQYHPESSPGPHDSFNLFHNFVQMTVGG